MKPVDRIRSDKNLHGLKKRVKTMRGHIGVTPIYRHKMLQLMVRLSTELRAGGWWDAMLTSQVPSDVTKYTNVIAKATDLRNWIYNNFPKQGDAWAVYQYDIDGKPSGVPLTTAQENALAAKLDSLLGGG